ncbi:peroxide stress protein YaaA [Hoyosella rhizosphaerae]|nr:peroxide stress protein YaaA [Hoyosella rhizosphaerae]MBN4926285.1 peroxide stress protein YaaA [Hoyosella rhizosphaerae]
MLILLPPSESKSPGGTGPKIEVETLSLPQLNPIREHLMSALVELAQDEDACAKALKLGPRQSDDITANAQLRQSPTMAAIDRYTGVLYDALDIASMKISERGHAVERLAIGSALFGVVRADDQIPYYKFSATARIPGQPTLRALWRTVLSQELEQLDVGIVIDLRSGGYAALGPVEGAVTATVVTEREDGSRKVVSHFNKHHKGLLARALSLSKLEPTDISDVASIAKRNGLHAEVSGESELTIVTQP